MSNKELSVVSYLTIFGWLYAYIKGKEQADSLLKYHLRQFFGLFLLALVVNIVITVLIRMVPGVGPLSYLSGIVFLVLWVFGLLNAVNGVEKSIPLVGKLFEGKFAFIG
ncbi:import component protein [Niabella drilacis]|uniref:Import component protein n=1 Tax=Niabella drilacis (strain DSM 25811 / CCM 8410 / CCUG 62505 / LMG 26954 / E90) TaxID=1285928 RepID=A0A1G6LYJ9_NIADE|nr:import component protein [Niabella drilacis]SDC48352.1 hypothetical protein SAMN04487894_102500 [Niabella drilacis]